MKARYLFPKDYMADPSANVFNGRCMSIHPMTGIVVRVSTMMVVTSR